MPWRTSQTHRGYRAAHFARRLARVLRAAVPHLFALFRPTAVLVTGPAPRNRHPDPHHHRGFPMTSSTPIPTTATLIPRIALEALP